MKRLKTALPALLFTFVSAALFAKEKVSAPLEITILHINDYHSHLEPEEIEITINGVKTKTHIGGYPELVHQIKEIKKTAKNPITLHSGDALTGTLYFTLFAGKAD